MAKRGWTRSGSSLSCDHYLEYLLATYFHKGRDLEGCVERAYLDVCRTIRGLDELEERRKEVHDSAVDCLTQRLEQLCKASNEREFNEKHRRACKALKRKFPDKVLSDGQAQKWINMSLKDAFLLVRLDKAEGRLRKLTESFERVYKFCHAPLDGIVMDELKNDGGEVPSTSWSKLDYPEYHELQGQMKDMAHGEPLLDFEFRLWLKRKRGNETSSESQC